MVEFCKFQYSNKYFDNEKSLLDMQYIQYIN